MRLDAAHVQASLIPSPAAAAWSLHADPECGAPLGPVQRGVWIGPDPLILPAERGDLLRLGDVSDCVPE